MQRKRITAFYADDPRCRIVILAMMTADGHLLPEAEASGYSVDWDDESESYEKYPFVLEPEDLKYARLRWRDDPAKTRVEIMGRRLLAGETILYRDAEGSHRYTIESVVADAGASGGTPA